MSDAHIYQGHEGIGVDVSCVASFWAWNLMQFHIAKQLPSMALLIPGQKSQSLASNCVFVMPWCYLSQVQRTFSFLMEEWWGFLHGTQVHLQQWVTHNVASSNILGMGLPWFLWASHRWWYQLGHTSQHLSHKQVEGLPFGQGVDRHGGWQYPM